MTLDDERSKTEFVLWATDGKHELQKLGIRELTVWDAAWQARQPEVDRLRKENSMLRTYEIGSLTLGEKFAGRISEDEAVELVNCIIRAQRDEALRGNQEV